MTKLVFHVLDDTFPVCYKGEIKQGRFEEIIVSQRLFLLPGACFFICNHAMQQRCRQKAGSQLREEELL
jgi:hypothetical protein